ncbi:hypothetical protein [Leptospira stimsonii]|nr:hypothetical protein [Leptospira stimsonii]
MRKIEKNERKPKGSISLDGQREANQDSFAVKCSNRSHDKTIHS